MGVPAVVALAAALVVLYSLWGASVLKAERAAAQTGVSVVYEARQ